MKKQSDSLKYGMYMRKSSDDDDKQAQSIPDQKRALSEFIQKESLVVGIEFPGESQSAHTPGRPVFTELVKSIMNGKIDAILAWHPNRLSRNPVDAGTIIYLMDIGKLRQVKTLTKTFENTSSDKFFLYLELIISKKDSDDKSEVVKRALEGRAKRGLPHGVAHIGFLNDLSEEKGSRGWLKDETRYPLVEELLTKMLTGTYSVRELHAYAKDKLKLTTPIRKRSGGQPIALSYMYTLLKDPIHAGFFFQKRDGERERYEFKAFAPMISEDDYWKIQSLLGKKGVPRVTHRQAVYNHFTKCGNCSGQLSTDFKFQLICSGCKKKFSHLNKNHCPACGIAIEEMQKPTFLTYIFYYCINHKKQRTNCPGNGIEEKSLETQLLSDMEDTLLISKELSAWCIDNIAKIKDEAIDDTMNLQKNLAQEKTTIEGKLRRLMMIRISNDHSQAEEDQHQLIEKELREELASLEKKTSETNINWINEATKDFNLMAEISTIIKDGSVEQKRELLAAFGSNLTIFEKKVAIKNKKSIEAFKDCLLRAKIENEAFEPASFRLDKTKSTLSGAHTNSLLHLLNTIRTSIQEDKESKFYYFALKQFLEQGV